MGSKFHSILPVSKLNESDLKGKVVAVDATAWIHQFLKVTMHGKRMESKRLVIMDSTCQVINHLRGFLYRTLHLVKSDIWPVFVFDGAGSIKLRNKIPRNRLHDAHLIIKRAHDAAIEFGMNKLAQELGRNSSFVYPIAELEVKMLLEFLGMPVIMAPGEAEAQCSWLENEHLVDGIVTKDADGLLYGSEIIYRQLAVRQGVVERYVLSEISSHLGLEPNQLIDLAILVGTDYNEGVPRIGPKTALKLLKTHHTIEEIAFRNPTYKWDVLGVHKPEKASWSEKIDKLRNIFLNPPLNEQVEDIQWLSPNTTAVEHFLCEFHSMGKQPVAKACNQLIQYMS